MTVKLRRLHRNGWQHFQLVRGFAREPGGNVVREVTVVFTDAEWDVITQAVLAQRGLGMRIGEPDLYTPTERI